jgi:hypothetical protein
MPILLELLAVLAENYEERRYPIPRAEPQQTLRHLMEARHLTQKDLWKIFDRELRLRYFMGSAQSVKRKRKNSQLIFTSVRICSYELCSRGNSRSDLSGIKPASCGRCT